MKLRLGRGAWIIALAAIIAIGVSTYDYFSTATGLQRTGGVVLTGIAGVLMLAAAFGLMARARGALAATLRVLILLDIIGTAVAGYFLESGCLMASMLVALLGWGLDLSAGRGEGR
jgi:uncharacterized membrane protein